MYPNDLLPAMAQVSSTPGHEIVEGLEPPPGVIPNSINPQNDEEVMFIFSGIGSVLATLCVLIDTDVDKISNK